MGKKSTKKSFKKTVVPPIDDTYPPVAPELLAQMAATLYGEQGAKTAADAVQLAFNIAVQARDFLENESIREWHSLTSANLRTDTERVAHARREKFGFDSVEFKEFTPWDKAASKMYDTSDAPKKLAELLLSYHTKDTVKMMRKNGLSFHELNLALNLKVQEDNQTRGLKLTESRVSRNR